MKKIMLVLLSMIMSFSILTFAYAEQRSFHEAGNAIVLALDNTDDPLINYYIDASSDIETFNISNFNLELEFDEHGNPIQTSGIIPLKLDTVTAVWSLKAYNPTKKIYEIYVTIIGTSNVRVNLFYCSSAVARNTSILNPITYYNKSFNYTWFTAYNSQTAYVGQFTVSDGANKVFLTSTGV